MESESFFTNQMTVMKFNLSKILLAAAIAIPAAAQAEGWNFGAEAGYVYSNLATEEYNAKGRSGFKFGLDAEYTLRNNVAFETGLAYIRKGSTVTGEKMNGFAVSEVKYAEMDYLQIPVMAGYKFRLGNGFSLKPEAGAYFAVGLGGDSFITGRNPFDQPYTARVSTFKSPEGQIPYRGVDRCDGGLSFALNANYKHFGIKAQYDLGLATVTYFGNGKQRAFSLSLEYWLF